MENKIAKDQDEGGEWITVSRGRRRYKKEKTTEISFLFSNFPDFMTQDDLRKVFAKYGQVVDVHAEKNLKNFGKRIGFVNFINIGDVQTFETLLNRIWFVNDGRYISVTHLEKGEQSFMISTMDQQRSYAGLPMDILSNIAGRLTPMDLLSFRGTCKDFRSASSDASAKIEFSDTPWLLFHKANSSGYIFYDECNNKTYSRNIPDLEGASCLGSDHGWLLVFKDESIFFLSPFFLTKIVVPDFPRKNACGHVATFSDVPTSPHCVISIFSRILEEAAIEVNMIRRGQSVWTQHKVQIPYCPTDNDSSYFTGRAKYDHKSQTFYYIDEHKSVLKLAVKDEQCILHLVLVHRNDYTVYGWDPVFKAEREGSIFEDRVTVYGSKYKENGRVHDLYVQSVDFTTRYRFRMAIRIQPRFFQVEGNHHW